MCVVWGSVLQKGHGGDVCLTSSILFKFECWGGTFVCSELDYGTTRCCGKCCFGMMYVELYGVCNFVVFDFCDMC